MLSSPDAHLCIACLGCVNVSTADPTLCLLALARWLAYCLCRSAIALRLLIIALSVPPSLHLSVAGVCCLSARMFHTKCEKSSRFKVNS